MKRQKTIAYLLKMFPRFAETFILNEILELEQQGASLHILSLKYPNETFRQERVKQVQSPVTYIPEPFKPEDFRIPARLGQLMMLVWINAVWFFRNPAKYWNAFRACRNSGDRRARRRWLMVAYIARLLKNHRIDHVHAHFANDPATVAHLVHLLTGIPYSFTAHAKDIYLSPVAGLQEKIHRAAFVVTCTRSNRDYLQGIALNGTPIYAVYHGLDGGIFGNGKLSLRPRPERAHSAPPVILSVGRLVEKKGFDCLIRACHLLREWGVPFRCQIIGEGPVEEKLRRLIADLQLQETVHLSPFMPQQALLARYTGADVFALPCQITANGDRDGIPNVLVEAMAVGLPVVATEVAGIAEIVKPGRNGILVPPRQPAELATALKSLLEDPPTRRRLGAEGIKTAQEHFNLTGNVARLRQLLFETGTGEQV